MPNYQYNCINYPIHVLLSQIQWAIADHFGENVLVIKMDGNHIIIIITIITIIIIIIIITINFILRWCKNKK